ncbi:MAG: rRNA maturation RNase YbeY [Salibacteraceae bacterium]
MTNQEINFFFEDIEEFVVDNSIIKWLETSTIELLSVFVINYIFCTDDYLLAVNKEYLNHDYYTDIITFDNSDMDSGLIESDIFISIDRVREHANERNISFKEELCRVLIHGVLHMAKYNDKTDVEQLVMTQMEDKYLALHPEL